ncbi:MAG TPA: SDR family oxidoreductase [Candidatus Cybelea sp.]|nr:SDR family oxidoreductase [Candidatus Cybelea sp.]
MSAPKVALITGASTGFGRLTSETLARRGYTVFASMRDIAARNAVNRRELESLASDENLDLHVIEMDVTDDTSVERCVAQLTQSSGRLDVVVNNAGFGNWGLTEAYSVAQFKLIFDTNFFGVVRVNRAVLPLMRRQGSGLLIHISSGAGRVSIAFMAPYCATKFALEALADAYRFELAPWGVDSVIVEPGEYRTPIFDKNMTAEDVSRASAYGPTAELPSRLFETFTQNMSGPMAQQPQEVADAILKLMETPPGQRPLRTLVGQDAQVLEGLNQMSEQIRQGVMTDLFRMPELLELKVPRVARPASALE